MNEILSLITVNAETLGPAHHLPSALPSHHYPLSGCLVASLPPWGGSAGEPADHRCCWGNFKWEKEKFVTNSLNHSGFFSAAVH